MNRFVGLLLCIALIMIPAGSVAIAGQFTLSLETNPQIVDILGTSIIKVRLMRGANPVTAVQIFLGLQGIPGKLRSEVLVTDNHGYATTEFIPSSQGSGFVLAKATINDSGKIESVEALAPIIVKDLNMEPTSLVDQIYPLPGRVGQTMTFRGHGKDPDGRIIKCEWVMGDGKAYEGKGEYSEITHTYTLAGTFEVKFTVTDERNVQSKPVISRVTVIDNKMPVLAMDGAWPEKSFIDTEVAFPVLAMDAESQLMSLSIDFGDQTTERLDISGGTFRHTFTHTYARPGLFNITVIAQDRYGEGQPFPQPAWPLLVEGEAKGELTLKITGAYGKAIRLVGPLPQWNVAFEAILGDDTIVTGQTLSAGAYHLLASDSSFGFTDISGPVEVIPLKTRMVETSVWIPSVSFEPVVRSGKTGIEVKISDQTGMLLKKTAIVLAVTDNGTVEGQTEISDGTGFLWAKPTEPVSSVTVSARIGFVKCQASGKIQLPNPPTSIRLSPRAIDGSLWIGMDSNVQVSGQMGLTWTLYDRIEGRIKSLAELFENTPARFYLSGTPNRFPIRLKSIDPDRYIATVAGEMMFGGVKISDICRFDPCAVGGRFDYAWGMQGDGTTGIKAIATDSLGNPGGSQLIRISYEFGRAISWIPEYVNFKSFPKLILTDSSGMANTSINLRGLLEGIEVEDVKVTFTALCGGVTHSKTISIPVPKAIPAITATVENDGYEALVTIKAYNLKGEKASGCWLDVNFFTTETKSLGSPPSSIRTSYQGSAFLKVRMQKMPVKASICATIDKIPAMCIIEIPKTGSH